MRSSPADLTNFVCSLPTKELGAWIAECDRLLEKEACEGRLIDFFKVAWSIFDAAPYEEAWHLRVVAEHLEAVSNGDIKKLLINLPPRHGKTLLTSVAWPAWTWLRKPNPDFPLWGPQVKFMCLSYGGDLAMDSATTMLRLIQSAWYQRNWGKSVKVIKTGIEKIDNSANGSRISGSFLGTTTGRGGDIKIIDDPHKVTEAESESIREQVINTYDEVLKSRITDPRHSSEVIVMQRVHVGDLAGHVLETGDFTHLCLPAEFDGRRCFTVLKWDEDGQPLKTWEDPRQEEGEPLWKDRFSEEYLLSYKRLPYSWAGQYQQMPVPRGGGILKEQWWGDWTNDKHWPTFDYMIASLDGAYTTDTKNDPSALIILGIYTDENENRRIMLVEAWRRWLEINDLVTEVAKSCKEFKVDRLIIENKASGKSVAQELLRLFAGELFGVELINPLSKDKEARVRAIVSLFTDGLTFNKETKDWEGSHLINTNLSKDWAQLVVQECSDFPNGKHDDLTDALVLCLQYLRDMGLAELGWEIRERQAKALQYRRSSNLKPLYSA